MNRHYERLELDKILAAAASHAVLEGARARILSLEPTSSLLEAEELLSKTEEAKLLLFELGAGRVEQFDPIADAAGRAEKGATLSCKELLAVSRLLRSARLFFSGVNTYSDGRISRMRALAEPLIFDKRLEEDISSKILSEDTIADTASEKLFSIRREIALLGERIRARLAEYLTGDEKKYLQEGIVTVRGDRYVIPVKAEYKRAVKGFVHDRSQSGATVFIEPEQVLEMNNELKSLTLDEKEEEERILSELSKGVGKLKDALLRDEEILYEADSFFARAEYCYRQKGVRPVLDRKGVLHIVRGRHPLLDAKIAVPVSVGVGESYDFLLISGANTGGKTVTLKMCGLFCLMAACGFFVPAEEARIPVFEGVFCDIGDSQSIEENLSTFSSHVKNLEEILSSAGKGCFVLIDEPGGGTDPEEGQALARAVLVTLKEKGCRGIVTTHYSALKEFAYEQPRMENGCMEFDAEDFRPLFRLKIGAPGSSNALAICTRLGVPEEVVERARGYLSEGARSFERTLRAAEEGRIAAEAAREEAEALKAEWNKRLTSLERDEEKLKRERERFLYSSKAEARRIVTERTARAEELLSEIEALFRKETLSEADLIRARTLKNKMGQEETEEKEPPRRLPVEKETLSAGDKVYVGAIGAEGEILSLKREKGTAEVRVGSLRVTAKLSDLFTPFKQEKPAEVRVVRDLQPHEEKRECNLIGMTVLEALPELENFLDGAVLAGLKEVRVVHGMGSGKLRAAVRDALKRHPRVESFRAGVYGEGESGVTIVTLK